MNVAYICIRERHITEMYLAFAAECGEARGDKPRNAPQLLLEYVPSPWPSPENKLLYTEKIWLLLSWKTEFGRFSFHSGALGVHLDSWDQTTELEGKGRSFSNFTENSLTWHKQSCG